MSPPSRKKERNETIPNLEAELKAIRAVLSEMKSTQQSTISITEELTESTKDLQMNLETLRETDKSLRIYSSECSNPTRPIGRFKKPNI
jgi:hypothetical protein